MITFGNNHGIIIAMNVTLRSSYISVLKNVLIISNETEFAIGTNWDTAPSEGWQTEKPETTPGEVLWQRTKATFDDGTTSYYNYKPVPGELEFTADKTVLDYYADDYPVSEEDITVTARTSNFNDYLTIINWLGQEQIIKVDTYTMKIPADALIGQSSITVTAKIGTLTRTIAITKNTLQGELELTAERTVLDYYADDVEITDGDKITVTAKATNYKAYPTIECDGVLVATGESDSVSYDVLATSLYGKSGAVIKAKIGTLTKTMEITKSYEQGNISIESDISVFGYYADNMPHNSTEYSTLAITQSGYSKMPTLYIEGVEKEYQSINESGNGTGTYAILSTELLSRASMTAKISIMDNTQLLTLYKRLDSPQISLSLSEPVAEYYYDNVAITGDIKAEVSYSGLYYAPLLKAGDTPILLSDEGKATVPISLFDDVDAGLAITAYASKNITYGTTASIQKQKRQLKLSLGISGAQFSYDSLGNPSPESITISNNTEGLSDKGKVLLVVGGESKGWDSDGKYIITPDMVTGRYLAVSIGYGSDSSTAIITKTYDGKAEEFQYSKTKSFRIYPDDEYGFVYTDEHLEYNGNEFAWLIPWSVNIPDVSSNEYLWRRSRSDSDSGWQYARMTGVKGEDGENAGGQYLGHYRTAPTERADGTAIEDGDYYLDVSTDGEPLPYRYKDGSWVLVTSSDPDWSAIASATIGDVNNYAGSLLSTSSYYGFFQLLSAQKAFIASLGTQELTLTDGGAIMSESYKASNGAEGFRIDADGNVDFNEGTFRGSFANGLSFIPPTRFKIDKSMSQREAYQKMKKAGIVAGIYEAGSQIQESQDFVSKTVSADGSYASETTILTNASPAFTCLDYSEEKAGINIPFSLAYGDTTYYLTESSSEYNNVKMSMLGLIFDVLAIGFDAYLLQLGHTYQGTSKTLAEFDGFYLLTKAKLEEFIASTSFSDLEDIGTNLESMRARYLVRQDMDDIYVNIASRPFYASMYPYYDPDTSTTYILADDKNLNGTVHLYRFTEGDSAVSHAGTISNTWDFEFMQIMQYILPSAFIHKIDGKYQMRFGYGTASEYARHGIFESTDMLNWENICKNLLPPENTFILDSIIVNGRIFATMYVPSTDTDSSGNAIYKAGFYELIHGDWELIPRDKFETAMTGNDIFMSNLFYHDGKIYGGLVGTFFSYDVESSVFTDRTLDILRDVEIEVAPARYYSIVLKNHIQGITTFSDSSSSPYSGQLIQGAYQIREIRWDNKEQALFIYVQIESVGNAVPMFYDPAKDEYRLFNIPIINAFVSGASTVAGFKCSSLISDPTRRVFVANDVATIAFSGISFSKPQLSFDNWSRNEFVARFRSKEDVLEYYNANKESWLLYYYSMYMVRYLLYANIDYGAIGIRKTTEGNQAYILYHDYYLYPDRHMIDIDSDTIGICSIYPIYDCRNMVIRETDEELSLYIASGTTQQIYLINPMPWGLGSFSAIPAGQADEISTKVISGRMQPFLTIKKDSDEPVDATFFWNFPAQLTTREGLGKVSNQL